MLILGTCFQALQVVTAGLYPEGIQVNTVVVAELVSVYKCFMYEPSNVPNQDYLGWSNWNTMREYEGLPFWFIGFAKKGSGIATVGAFVPSRQALMVTPKNKPSQIRENIWWHYNNVSFGFAPNSTINQNKVDIFNPTDPRRLSILSTDDYSAGARLYRLGATPVGEESQYYSLFFVCDPSKTSPPTPSPTATTVPPTKRCRKEPTKCPTRKPTKHRCRPTRSPKPAREWWAHRHIGWRPTFNVQAEKDNSIIRAENMFGALFLRRFYAFWRFLLSFEMDITSHPHSRL